MLAFVCVKFEKILKDNYTFLAKIPSPFFPSHPSQTNPKLPSLLVAAVSQMNKSSVALVMHALAFIIDLNSAVLLATILKERGSAHWH